MARREQMLVSGKNAVLKARCATYMARDVEKVLRV
jgi:hypothetical protein